jgi:hypothetical protein
MGSGRSAQGSARPERDAATHITVWYRHRPEKASVRAERAWSVQQKLIA